MPAPTTRLTPFLEFTPSASERTLLDTMSAESTPIPPARFAAALESLSVGSLHLKAAEIRNQLAHLRSSNTQLAEFADDKDCADAIKENEGVIERFEERIEMLKAEVVKRGMPWVEEDPTKGDQAEPGELRVVGEEEAEQRNQSDGSSGARSGGSIGDEELARRLQERMSELNGHGEDDGVHL